MKNITINTLDLREQIALSLSAFLDPAKYSVSDIALKMANEIELMSINREDKRGYKTCAICKAYFRPHKNAKLTETRHLCLLCRKAGA